MSAEIESSLRSYLVSSFGYRGMTADLGREVLLLDEGVLDSTGVLEVASFLESDLGVTVADEDMVPDNFGSLARMVAYVARKKAG